VASRCIARRVEKSVLSAGGNPNTRAGRIGRKKRLPRATGKAGALPACRYLFNREFQREKMAKGRMLQKRISTSSKMTQLSSDTVRLLYTWLLAHLDVNGNFYADPVMVNNLVFTRLGHSSKTVAAAIDELANVGLIVLYQIDGETYLNYPDFFEKQPKLNPDREGNSDIPNITPESLLNNSGVNQEPLQQQKTQYKINIREYKSKIMLKEGFEEFWSAYPRKVNKKEAMTSWNKAKTPPLEEVLSAIEKQRKSDQWLEDGGKYIPYPSTWLNKEKWNDELISGGNGNGTNRKRTWTERDSVNAEAGELADAAARRLKEKLKASVGHPDKDANGFGQGDI